MAEEEIAVWRIDANLAIWYKAREVEYEIEAIEDANGKEGGLFAQWSYENGYQEDGSINEELEMEKASATTIVEFVDVDDFPFPNDDDKNVYTIFQILRECNKDNPNFAQFKSGLPKCM